MIKHFITWVFIKTYRRKPDNRTLAEKRAAFEAWSRHVGPQESEKTHE